MLGRTYGSQNCSIARALELVGERWTILVLRDVFLGLRRFDQIQANLGVGRNVLSSRLQRLCDEGILDRHRYQEHPQRFEYALTAKGRDLSPVLVALMKWGDRHHAPHGPPRVLHHRDCGGEISDRLVCTTCRTDVTVSQIVTLPGPGAET